MPSRSCARCNRKLSSDDYSKHQWSKGAGTSICSGCLHQNKDSSGGTSPALIVDPGQAARRNISSNAIYIDYDLKNPFASGSFRLVAKGAYTTGNRTGQACVCKWFKNSGTTMEDEFFATDIATSKEAVRLITIWNSNRLIDRMVKINLPEVWTFEKGGNRRWSGRQVLQEPFIEDYQKFNSNSGWADDTLPWPRVMQALSHFTHHISKGQKLLCDLQGGVYKDGVILTDPVIMSAGEGGQYGPTDLGSKGISNFFARHKCNKFCQSSWRQPHNPTKHYTRTVGTTMIARKHVPTHKSCKPMTRAAHHC
jgi:Alpha-kinase family